MIMVRFYFPTCTLNWVQARTRAPMGEKKEKVCESLVTLSLPYQLLYKYLLFKLEALYKENLV